jgi:hypothetical protein
MFHKSSAGRVCADCLIEEEEQFIMVRDFLEQHPGCTMGEITQATEVDEAVIMRFLREGRLATLGDLAGGVKGECLRCRTEIAYGKYCKACIEEMGSALKDSARELGQQAVDEQRRGLTRRPETIRDRRLDGS